MAAANNDYSNPGFKSDAEQKLTAASMADPPLPPKLGTQTFISFIDVPTSSFTDDVTLVDNEAMAASINRQPLEVSPPSDSQQAPEVKKKVQIIVAIILVIVMAVLAVLVLTSIHNSLIAVSFAAQLRINATANATNNQTVKPGNVEGLLSTRLPVDLKTSDPDYTITWLDPTTNVQVPDSEKIFRSQQFGGEGGNPFTSQEAYKLGGPITGFHIWIGEHGLVIQTMHSAHDDIKRGNIAVVSSVNDEVVLLSPGEVIVKANVTWDVFVCSLSFVTSTPRVFGPYKRRARCHPEHVDIVEMKQLLYFTGRHGDWLDAIAFTYY